MRDTEQMSQLAEEKPELLCMPRASRSLTATEFPPLLTHHPLIHRFMEKPGASSSCGAERGYARLKPTTFTRLHPKALRAILR